MEDFYINDTSVYESHNYSDYNYSYYDYYQWYNYEYTGISNEQKVPCYIVMSIGFPLILLVFYGVYSQVRNNHVAPIYIINLLISDLIQLCTMIVDVAEPENPLFMEINEAIYGYGLMTSIGFMVCVALERYLVIAWPLWYRFRRNIKTSVVVCVIVWVIPLVFLVSGYLWLDYDVSVIILGVYFLPPFPLFIFFLFGTIKALSAAISVTSDEKRRIVAILVLVLLIYTLLFFPFIIESLLEDEMNSLDFIFVSNLLPRLSPLADLFLYVFSRKGAADRFLAFVCRCRMNSDSDISTVTV